MKITALLTGKKNSTFKNKNQIKLHNDYIFNYPAKQARKVKEIDFFYTSSDSNIILKQTKKKLVIKALIDQKFGKKK